MDATTRSQVPMLWAIAASQKHTAQPEVSLSPYAGVSRSSWKIKLKDKFISGAKTTPWNPYTFSMMLLKTPHTFKYRVLSRQVFPPAKPSYWCSLQSVLCPCTSRAAPGSWERRRQRHQGHGNLVAVPHLPEGVSTATSPSQAHPPQSRSGAPRGHSFRSLSTMALTTAWTGSFQKLSQIDPFPGLPELAAERTFCENWEDLRFFN